MLDSELFTLMVVVFALWLLVDDVRKGLKDANVKLPINISEPGTRTTVRTYATLKRPVPVFTPAPALRREEQAAASAGKALGMH
ncbi:MAG: hypothetical protein KA392_16635 [Candidatus Obscuribacter sp.]|jgi:hypothetical protein|nr:hypothetical protein [Candidatus Obscuribacter sp.]MDQ5964052.1 hypothetical protein [Cyanobacteriota bacterium erpe_2018_sw_39hr_WHONDRS-SW48-000098_B_bin.30]MBK7840891.1 hypothetical protein [Candidatus Obscuribacter sp.]MBK9206651.1 hypothetical protein [Candidatus Obscuribacter sp.]MBK9620836.1 hypothetical protein [Candidatus Obscuribacter sp.]